MDRKCTKPNEELIMIEIGTEFYLRKDGSSKARKAVVTDIYRTYNSCNELVKVRYVIEYIGPLGQKITDRDVLPTTIKRCIAESK